MDILLIRLIIMFQIVKKSHSKIYDYIKFIHNMIIKYSYEEFSDILNELKRQPRSQFGHMLLKNIIT